jgi:hypothetical protein
MLVRSKKVLLLALLLTPLLVPLHARSREAHQKRESIVGKWSSMIRERDGSGITFEFRADGSFTQTFDYERVARYKLKDNRLSIRAWNSKDSREDEQIFALGFEANELVAKDQNGGMEVRMKPVEGGRMVAENNLLGEWFSQNYPGVTPVVPLDLPLRFPAFVEFTKSGQVYFRGSLRSKSGHYEFSKNVLTTTLDGEASLERKVHVTSNRLDMPIDKSRVLIPFRRVSERDTVLSH